MKEFFPYIGEEPNQKLSANVVRNLSRKTHWCLKAHVAISRINIDKIKNIVANMLKVLVENLIVEQRELQNECFA
ncbi:hypothetical protein P8452_23390 [Trifolium repens]|nr:hypothetical protein P8452_23390 [Trifolium repens]